MNFELTSGRLLSEVSESQGKYLAGWSRVEELEDCKNFFHTCPMSLVSAHKTNKQMNVPVVAVKYLLMIPSLLKSDFVF